MQEPESPAAFARVFLVDPTDDGAAAQWAGRVMDTPPDTGTPELRHPSAAAFGGEAGFVGREEKRRSLDHYHPTGRIGTPEEVAALCSSILVNPSPFINGAVINLDGGIAHVLHDPD